MVEENLAAMRLEQELAKLESGRIKNLELRTLCRWATALGGQLEITVRTDRRRRPKTAAV